MLEFLQDCFEERSLANDFSTNSTKSVLCSTPKVKDSFQSPSKEIQKSCPKSVPVSSKKKEDFLPCFEEPSKTSSRSVQANEVHQKSLASDVGSRNTPDSKKISSRKLDDYESESDEEFYLSVGSPSVVLSAKTSTSQNTIPSVAQKRETYIFENSENMLSSSTEISLNTKKRLNFEDKDILKNIEIENEVSEVEDKISERQERKQSETSQKRIQGLELEIQPQATKKFSTLFLETVTRKSESSPIVRHTATASPHLSPPNDPKLLEDEFIIDESDRSFASRSWISIPRKAGPLKQRSVSPAESAAVPQVKKSKEKHHNISPTTLTHDNHLHGSHPVEKSLPCDDKKQGMSCALTDEVGNNSRSTKCETHSKNKGKSSGNKKTVKQKKKKKIKDNVVEEQLDMGQSKEENINARRKHIAPKLQRSSSRNMQDCEEMRNDHISKKVASVGSKQKKSTKKQDKQESVKKHSPSELKNKLVPEEVTVTVMRSQRISRRPSDWWVVKSQESPAYSGYSSIRNELSVHHNSRQKPAKTRKQSSKNIGKKAIPPKKQKTLTQGSSRAQKVVHDKGSGGLSVRGEIPNCSQNNKPMESDESDLAAKKNLSCSRSVESSKEQDGIMTAQNVRLKSQSKECTCKTPTGFNLDSVEPKPLVLEESGPTRLENNLMSRKKNSDVNDEDVQDSLDYKRVKRSQVTSEKKVHHKLVLPSNTPNVRRTKRIRLKPLEYWRGERIDYQGTPSGGLVIGGVLSPDAVVPKRKAKGNMEKANKVANGKRICLDNTERKNRLMVNLDIPLGDPCQPTRVKDPETREFILMDLIRPRDTYQFFVEHGELKVYKTLDTPFFSTGKLILGPHEEKGKQHVGPDILVFYVNFGDLLCTLHETPYLITTGDSFFVPSGNYYNIKNLLNEESVLLFTQIKR